jgi:membrane-associated protein
MLDPQSLIASGGLLLIAFMVFAESGLLFGIIFPGDTLLFAAGFFAAQGQFGIVELVAVIVVSSILGGNVGYSIGRRAGPRVFTKKDGLFFRHEYIEKSEKFYEAHGGKTIMFARFIPIIRTFAPVVAGVGKMDRKKFLVFNILGSGLWGASVTLAGYWLGSQFPHLADHIEKVFIVALPFIFAPPIYHIARDPVFRKKIKHKLLNLGRYIFLNKRP